MFPLRTPEFFHAVSYLLIAAGTKKTKKPKKLNKLNFKDFYWLYSVIHELSSTPGRSSEELYKMKDLQAEGCGNKEVILDKAAAGYCKVTVL